MKRTVLITGASRGMGKAEAIEFAKKGYNVIINYSSNKEKADAVKNEIENDYGVKAIAIQADLRKQEDIERLVEESIKAFGNVDVLVNNAGYAIYGDVDKKTIDGFDEMMKMHVYAPFYLTKLLAPKMAENKIV